jgi:hypothetical protein
MSQATKDMTNAKYHQKYIKDHFKDPKADWETFGTRQAIATVKDAIKTVVPMGQWGLPLLFVENRRKWNLDPKLYHEKAVKYASKYKKNRKETNKEVLPIVEHLEGETEVDEIPTPERDPNIPVNRAEMRIKEMSKERRASLGQIPFLNEPSKNPNVVMGSMTPTDAQAYLQPPDPYYL